MNNGLPCAEQFQIALHTMQIAHNDLLEQTARDRNCIQEELAVFINSVTDLDALSTAIITELLSNRTVLAQYRLLLGEARLKIAELEAELAETSSRRGQPSLSQPSLPHNQSSRQPSQPSPPSDQSSLPRSQSSGQSASYAFSSVQNSLDSQGSSESVPR